MSKLKAISLIEIVIVLLITSVLSAMAWSVWPGNEFHVPVQARQVAGAISYLRDYAMVHSGIYRISFDAGAGTITLSDSAGNCIPYSLKNTCVVSLINGIRMQLNNIPFAYISFDSRGRPYRDNGIRLLTQVASVTLSANGRSSTVTIIPQSGMVSVS